MKYHYHIGDAIIFPDIKTTVQFNNNIIREFLSTFEAEDFARYATEHGLKYADDLFTHRGGPNQCDDPNCHSRWHKGQR